ncbi:Exopolyphosphatase [Ascosphaera acerosa]|nr:Exopolyphosphatase [Ascosphaera acerosa]
MGAPLVMAETYKRQGLLGFLREAVSHAHGHIASLQSKPELVFVLGNTSADLDSIVSAIIYAYFATSAARQYVPVVNLADVSSGPDLRRLRPELMAALRLSAVIEKGNDEEAEGQLLREILLTTKDIRQLLLDGASGARRQVKIALVDWNALPRLGNGEHGVPGLSDVLGDRLELLIVGCVDHHFDEGFIPSTVDPRRIQIPVGSCTSLVVSEVRCRNLWHEPGEDHIHAHHPDAVINEAQAAKLALSAILVDTINMTEEKKVSETDLEEVVFLEDKIRDAVSVLTGASWQRNEFYECIAAAKEGAVNNLTMQEVLGRDYKEWLEDVVDKPGETMRLGIMVVGKPLLWLQSKASQQHTALADAVHEFSQSRALDVAAVMTTFTDTEGHFNRELALFVFDEKFVDHARSFEACDAHVLRLTEWRKRTTKEMAADVDMRLSNLAISDKEVATPFFKAWQQEELAKSRKQVAPLLRRAISGQDQEGTCTHHI